MKITVLTGSPHRDGTTALLAERFIEGAQAAGHQAYRFDAAEKEVFPCLACDQCGQGCEPVSYTHLISAKHVPVTKPT